MKTPEQINSEISQLKIKLENVQGTSCKVYIRLPCRKTGLKIKYNYKKGLNNHAYYRKNTTKME